MHNVTMHINELNYLLQCNILLFNILQCNRRESRAQYFTFPSVLECYRVIGEMHLGAPLHCTRYIAAQGCNAIGEMHLGVARKQLGAQLIHFASFQPSPLLIVRDSKKMKQFKQFIQVKQFKTLNSLKLVNIV